MKKLLVKYGGEATVGFILGALYMPSSQLLVLASNYLPITLQTVTFFFYPLCLTIFGFGLVVGGRPSFPRFPGSGWAAALGIALLCGSGLLLPLSLHLGPAMIGGIAAILVLTCFAYFSLGAQFARSFESAADAGFIVLAVRFLLQAAGYVFALAVISHWGANGLLLFLAILSVSPSLGPRARLIVIAAALAMPWGKLDSRLESMRMGRFKFMVNAAGAEENPRTWKNVTPADWDCSRFPSIWSHRGLFIACPAVDGSGEVMAIENFQVAYFVTRQIDKSFRQAIRRQFAPHETVALLGFGGGGVVPEGQTGLSGANIYAIERDPATVRFFSEHGDAELKRIHYVNAEGRAFVERYPGKFDWIFLEGAFDQGDMTHLSIFSPFGLTTAESLTGMAAKLNDGGVLIFELNRLRRGHRAALFRSAEEILRSGLPGGFFAETVYDRNRFGPRGSRFTGYVLVSKSRERLDRLLAATTDLKRDGSSGIPGFRELCDTPLTDDTPFLIWNCDSRKPVFVWFFGAALSLTFMACLTLFLLAGKRREMASFFLFTVFTSLLFVATAYRLRAYFRDEIYSFYALTVLFYLGYAAVGLVYGRARTVIDRLATSWWAPVAAFSVYLAGLHYLPHEAALGTRAVFFVVAFSPAVAYLGAYYFSVLSAQVRPAGLSIQKVLGFEFATLLFAYSVMAFSLLYAGIALTMGVGMAFFAGAWLLRRIE